MAISNLTPVEEWPTRKLPQDRFDTAVKTAMDQMSVMVGELNSAFIPQTNEVIDTINGISPDLPTIIDAPNQAAAAAASAQQAAQSASQAAGSVTAAAQEVQKAKQEVVNAQAEVARAKSEADRAKEEADRAASVVAVDIATVEKAGIVKPDGKTTNVSPDGTLSVPTFGGSSVGLVPQATSEDAKKMLHGDGTWSEIAVFSGGEAGLVTGSGAAAGKVLQGSGSWGNTGLLPISERSQALGSVSGSRTVDLSVGLMVSATIAGATEFTFSGVPGDGGVVVVMQLTNGGSAAVTWPTSIKWAGGKAPKLTAAGTDIIVLTTSDSGASWYGVANLEYA